MSTTVEATSASASATEKNVDTGAHRTSGSSDDLVAREDGVVPPHCEEVLPLASDAGGVTKEQKMFEQNMHEISRRRDAKNTTGSENHPFFERSKHDGPSFASAELDDQRFVLFSLSQKEFAPVPTDLNNPGIRIYGTFAERDGALEHANDVLDKCHGVSMMMQETNSWFLCPAHKSSLHDSDMKSAMMNEYFETKQEQDAEFQHNLEQRLTGDKGAGLSEPCKPVKVSDDQKRFKATRAPVVGDQKYAVVSFVRESKQKATSRNNAGVSFLCKCYACFATTDEADVYVRNTLSLSVRDFDIDVIQLNEWIYPCHVESHHLPVEEFRNPELNNIMKQFKSEPSRVAAFEKSVDIV